MKRHTLIGTVVFTIIIFTSVFVSAQSQKISKDVQVENKTNSLTVESITEIYGSNKSISGRRFEYKLRNNSDRPVSSISFITKDSKTNANTKSGFMTGSMPDHWMTLPSEINTGMFFAAPKGEVTLIISAVLFDDGSGEGDSDDLTRLQNERAGIKLAFQHIVKILQNSLVQSENIDSISAIQSLQKEVDSLSKENIPSSYTGGFHNGRSYVKIELEDIEDKLNKTSKTATKDVYISAIAEEIARLQRMIRAF